MSFESVAVDIAARDVADALQMRAGDVVDHRIGERPVAVIDQDAHAEDRDDRQVRHVVAIELARHQSRYGAARRGIRLRILEGPVAVSEEDVDRSVRADRDVDMQVAVEIGGDQRLAAHALGEADRRAEGAIAGPGKDRDAEVLAGQDHVDERVFVEIGEAHALRAPLDRKPSGLEEGLVRTGRLRPRGRRERRSQKRDSESACGESAHGRNVLASNAAICWRNTGPSGQ